MLMHTKFNRYALRIVGIVLLFLMLFTSCKSQAERLQEQLDLGQKYLMELNYAEAILAFTDAIEIDPENIPAYMGRAEAYRGTEQYAEAKTDYTAVIDKTAEQPYTQAVAYVGRAEVNELTADENEALADYESAADVLETVEVEKIEDVTEQMLEALKIQVYNAYARLSALLGRHEAAVASYTKAIYSLDRLPDDTEVLDVGEQKQTAYEGRSSSNWELEQYEAVLPDYDCLIELGEDKEQERDALLSALSLAKSKAADLNASGMWLDEVNHNEYAKELQMDSTLEILTQAAMLAQENGTKAYNDIKALLNTEDAQNAMQSILAHGYQLRYYDEANDKMLAVYAGETSWADVDQEENGTLSPEMLEAYDTMQEEMSEVDLSPLYVYYGEYEERKREGEGIWYILDPSTTDVAAQTYRWENDSPVGGFKKQIISKTYTSAGVGWDGVGIGWPGSTKYTYALGGTTIKKTVSGIYYQETGRAFTLSKPIIAASEVSTTNSRYTNKMICFTVPANTTIRLTSIGTWSTDNGSVNDWLQSNGYSQWVDEDRSIETGNAWEKFPYTSGTGNHFQSGTSVTVKAGQAFVIDVANEGIGAYFGDGFLVKAE